MSRLKVSLVVLFSILFLAGAAVESYGADGPFSKETQITYHPATRIPKAITNINVYPSMLKEGAVLLTEKNVEAVFRNFLDEKKEVLSVKSKDLMLVSASKRRTKWHVKFQQFHENIPVYNATVGFTTSEKGMVISYGSSYYPDLKVSTIPKISIEDAVKRAKGTYDPKTSEGLSEKKVEKIIYPEKKPAGVVFHLAWKFLLSAKRPNPEMDKYFIVDAMTGDILLSYHERFPGASAHGTVNGEIYPANPTTPPVSTNALESEYVSADGRRGTTDASGRFNIALPWWYIFFSTYSATFRLEGPYARVQDCSGTDYVFTRTCIKSDNCDRTWTDADRDHINVFYHMNLIHDWYAERFSYEWLNSDGTNQFHAEVNCNFNNAYAGDPMSFGTDNFARSSDVIYHECTHNVLSALYGDYIGWPAAQSEGYAMDEGFADYFAGALTNDPVHGEGYGGNRSLDNNKQYAGKRSYNSEGHYGGGIIAGAAWDLREMLIDQMDAVTGAQYADRLVFDAHESLAAMPRDYYFSDPQESNLLKQFYLADDDNNNLNDGIPHFFEIQRAFANHNLMQATLNNRDSFDVSTNTIGELTGGDFYYSGGQFWGNNAGQRGVVDLGAIGAVALDQVNIPSTGYTRFGVSMVVDHTYVSLAQQGEEGNHIIFRVTWANADNSQISIEYFYTGECAIMPPNPQIGIDHTDAQGRIYIPVSNWLSFPNAMFRQAPELPPCGLNTNSSRTWVDIYNADTNAKIYGFCAFGSNADLRNVWFKPSTSHGNGYIIIHDRTCNRSYRSNTIAW